MADSILGKILDAAVTAAQGLSLSGVNDSSIVQVGGLTATTLDSRQIPPRPCVIFSPFGPEVIPDGAGTNKSDDITYRVACVILDKANNDHNSEKLDDKYYWRELLIDHFIHNALSVSLTNAVLFDQTLEPQPIINLGAWAKNWFLSAFVIKFIVRKQRRA